MGIVHPLSYVARRSRFSRRKIIWLVLLLTLGGTALACRGWIRRLISQARYLSSQRSCLNYTTAPSIVVYEEDPVRANALIANPVSIAELN